MKIALVGLGTTGKFVAEYLLKEKALAMVLCRKGSSKLGKDLGDILDRPKTGLVVGSVDQLEEKLLCYQPDVVIDFSSPDFLSENLATLAKFKVNVVTAVTGYKPMDIKRIKLVAQNHKLGIVMAPNITYGVNVLMMMADIAAQLHRDYDFEIIEENHKNKQDSPSGTAEKMAEMILAALDKAGGSHYKVPIHSIRAGDIAGRHKVLICGKYDQIEISHTAFSRMAFAEGAYKAAQFIDNRTGFYEMKDVFRLERGNRKADRWENGFSDQGQARETRLGIV